jgi:hypothetical protein
VRRWLAGLFGSRAPARAGHDVPAAQVDVAPPAAAPAGSFVSWLLDAPLSTADAAPDLARSLVAVDEVLAAPRLPSDLLPRASAVVPQVIAMLKQEDLAIPALAEQVSRDIMLMAEVLRVAASPLYGQHREVVDLRHAIRVIGVGGVNAAIARVVLKPIFQSGTGALSSRTATRLWNHADVLAQHAAREAQRAGQPLFDGFLAGLLIDSGWTALCRVLDRHQQNLDPAPTAEQAAALEQRAFALFGQAAQGWTITPGFGAFAAEARRCALDRATHPLAGAIRAAWPAALEEVARDGS